MKTAERGEKKERNAARRKEGKGRPWTAARPGRGGARGRSWLPTEKEIWEDSSAEAERKRWRAFYV